MATTIEILFKAHNKELVNFLNCKLNNRELAEDMASNIFLKLLEQPEIRDENLRGLLFRSAKNEVIDYYRKQKSVLKHVKQETKENHITVNTENLSNSNDLKPYIENALKTLRPDHREVLELYIISGYKIKEISFLTNLKIGTVTAILKRSKDKLKEILQPQYNEYVMG